MYLRESIVVRVRFAPSPTGYLHIGSVRTALFNYLFARKEGGKFILRIEDTDQERSSDEYLREILENLKWMGLEWDEGPEVGGDYGPYFQMQRANIYRDMARFLLDSGRAYYCYCTREELAKEREQARIEKRSPGYSGRCKSLTRKQIASFEAEGRKPSIRFLLSDERKVVINDLVRGEVVFDTELIDDFIIMKSSGIPVYNFAVVVDDYLMKITHVIRGEEHLSNTPKQVLLYNALGYSLPEFAHLPIILDERKHKLSKRRGGVDLRDYRAKGYLPEAIFNFLALLGWSPGENLELMNRDEIISRFSLAGISKSPSIFDDRKLEWMNGKYINKEAPADLADLAEQFFHEKGFNPSRNLLERLAILYAERIRTLADFPEYTAYFFSEEVEYEQKAENKYFKDPRTSYWLDTLSRTIARLEEYNEKTVEQATRDLAEKMGISAARLIHPARVALTGKAVSPGLFEVMEIMGKDKVVHRLSCAADYVKKKSQVKTWQKR
ncbi:MAG: glutamate--tRNA ligase [Candidatus Eremiobacteraeota bacterium]|nr:glutamate--tRNA ligase [Candidatus Eremiobacteraeota bacterium]